MNNTGILVIVMWLDIIGKPCKRVTLLREHNVTKTEAKKIAAEFMEYNSWLRQVDAHWTPDPHHIKL